MVNVEFAIEAPPPYDRVHCCNCHARNHASFDVAAKGAIPLSSFDETDPAIRKFTQWHGKIFSGGFWRFLEASNIRFGEVRLERYSGDVCDNCGHQSVVTGSIIASSVKGRSYGISGVFQANRQNLFERDGFRCQYCNETFQTKDLNLDHVIPRDRGGKTSWENVVTSCIRCNSRKGNRLPHEAGMRLVRRPQKPRWRPFVSSIDEDQCDESWIQFMNLKS